MDRKVQGVARNIRNCATTILVGGWKRATIPTSSPGGCCPATEEILCFATVFLSSTHHMYFSMFCKSYFWWKESLTNRIVMHSGCAMCIHPNPADYHCCCTHFLSVFVKVIDSISELNLIIFMMGQFCSSVLGLTGTSSLSKGPLCLWQCFVSESVGEPDYSTPHLTL